MTSALDTLRAHYRDRIAAARAHHEAGGKVIAYLCDNVPVELIEAAGAFPLRVHGGPEVDRAPVRRHVDSLYPPDVTQRPDFVGAMLGRLLGGGLEFVDAVIVPHNRNAVQAIHRQLHDAQREHGLALPPTLYLDKAWSPHDEARAYNRRSIELLIDALGAITGTIPAGAALADAIAAHEERRRLIGRLVAARAARPGRIAGSLAIELIGASWAMPAATFNPLAAAALDALETAPPIKGPRLYLGGSPHDHPALYRLVEELGANVVAEDHCWGNRAADLPLGGDADPIAAIARRFDDFPACSIRLPLARGRDEMVRRALMAEADGALLYVMAGDTTQAWETPGEAEALRAAGVRVRHLRRQPYVADEAARAAIGAFIEELRA